MLRREKPRRRAAFPQTALEVPRSQLGPRAILGTIALVSMILAAGCAKETPPPSVILISIDTCRADHLGCYGHPGDPTPNLDRLADGALRFERAQTTTPMTFPAHTSLLTGTIPPYHGIHDNMSQRLGDGNVTLAERLSEAGYLTGAIVSAFVLDSRFHLDQGFATYDDDLEAGSNAGDTTTTNGSPPEPQSTDDPGGARETMTDGHGNERRATEVTDRALAWLDANVPRDGKQPFFLFLHYFDPHVDYNPPEPFRSRFGEDLYTGEIAYTDHEIGRVLQRLRDLDLYDSSVLIVIGDHGEGLGEHGEPAHDFYVYQSTIHVPFLLKPAHWNEGRAIPEVVSVTDVVPTVLAAAQIPASGTLHGSDLHSLFTESDAPQTPEKRLVYCESLTPTKYGCNPLLGLVSERWKFIQTTRPELYDLTADPKELTNLAGENEDRAAFLAVKLSEMIASSARPTGDSRAGVTGDSGDAGETGGAGGSVAAGAATSSVPDREVQERLKSLGYLSGRTSGGLEFDRTRPDAKDFGGVHARFSHASGLVNRGAHAEARPVCEALLRDHPQIVDTYLLLAQIERETGHPEAAVSRYERFFSELERFASAPGGQGLRQQLLPSVVNAHFGLANLLLDLGRRQEGLARYQTVLDLSPDHVEARFNLGVSYAEDGRVAEAMQIFNEVLRLQPEFAPAHFNLAQGLLLEGRQADARLHLERAVEIDPEYADARIRLGDIIAASGDPAGALAQYERARQSGSAVAHCQAARLYLAMGRAQESLSAYRDAIRTQPDWGQPQNELAWILATHPDANVRNGVEAMTLAEAARGRFGDQPAVLATLAAAYAENGRFNEAMALEGNVRALFERAGDGNGVRASDQRRAAYSRGEPFRGNPSR